MIITIITSILKSLVVPVIWLALIGAIYSRIAPFFALNRIFFPANEEATLKTKQPIRLQGLFKVTDQIAGRWKTWRIMWQILQLLFPKLLFFPPKKWMNLSPVFGRFQNGCNKVVIEPCVVQFWSEIILVISNWTRTARSFNFEITRMISAQIALHLVQLPLFIINKGQNYWALIGWERGHFFLIEGIFSNQERAWLPVNDWLIRARVIFLRINFALYW